MMQPSAELLLMPTNHKLIYFNEVDKGGHFATWEQPELFATELRAAFRSGGSKPIWRGSHWHLYAQKMTCKLTPANENSEVPPFLQGARPRRVTLHLSKPADRP